MGVEYRHFLIPQPNDHRPASDQGEALVRALIAERWLPPSRSPEYCRSAFERSEARLIWPVDPLGKSGLRYPFVESPPAGEETHYTIELHLADDYIYRTSEDLDPFEDTACACGAQMEYEPPEGDPFHASRLRRVCPDCRRPWDVGTCTAEGRDPWTGAAIRVPGGLCYRFAVVLDAGRGVPDRRGLHAHPELRALVQRTLGVRLADLGEIY